MSRKAVKAGTLEGVKYVSWDIHRVIADAIAKFVKDYGETPREVLLPDVISGVPLWISESLKNGVYIGPVPKKG